MNQNNKLFVGNLPYTVTSDMLREHFAQHGTVVDAVVLTDKFSGRSRGFGFVTMETADMAQAAMTALNEQDFQGRKLIISVARPQQARTNDRRF